MSTPHVLSSASAECLPINTTDCVFGEDPCESEDATPAWLTRDYMEKCLRTYFKDHRLKINQMDACPALKKGENYASVMTRVTAEYQTSAGRTKTAQYIVKSSFEGDDFARQLIEPYDVFNREMSIYEKVLPQFNDLLRSIGDDEQLSAQTLAVDYERSALIFEDLNERDFIMPDRLRGLDEDVAKLVLRKLAKMHAASAVLNEREGGSLETYDRGMFNRHTSNYAPCFVGLLEACTRLVNQWEDFKHYGQKLANLKPMYMELAKRVFDPTSGHLNVLAHGDLWTNNVMVKYDPSTGAPIDVIMIDFQYSAWGSPGIDLHYLLNTSLQEELYPGKLDGLIQYYYGILAETLRKLTYKAYIPSLHNFHIQLDDKAFYAFSSACVILPVHRNEVNDDADFNALMQENERAINFKNTCYKNAFCQRIIRKQLPVFERQGLLEVEQ